MTTNPPDSGFEEPADLSELTATDALLDRLAARDLAAEDLLDPTAAALAELLAEVDAEQEPDLGMARLVEVLAGRPLYVGESKPSITLPTAEDDDAATRVIDLTDHADPTANDAVRDELADLDPDELDPLLAPLPQLIPAQAGREAIRRIERVLSHISLPAAAVLLLIALGGGLTAAVTGNPMAPVDGVSQVVAKLPGVSSGPERTLKHVRGEISAAKSAIAKNDTSSATAHLSAAQRGLPDVPDNEKQALGVAITNVQTLLPPTTSPVTGPTTGSGVIATTAPPASPPPTPSSSTSTTTTAPATTPTSVAPTVAPTTAPPVTPTESASSPESVIAPSTLPPSAAGSTPSVTDSLP